MRQHRIDQPFTMTVGDLGFFSFVIEKFPKTPYIGSGKIIGGSSIPSKKYFWDRSIYPMKTRGANFTLAIVARE